MKHYLLLFITFMILTGCFDDNSGTNTSLNWDRHCVVTKLNNGYQMSKAIPDLYTFIETESYTKSDMIFNMSGEFNTQEISCEEILGDFYSKGCKKSCSNGSFSVTCTNDLLKFDSNPKEIIEEDYESALEDCEFFY